MKFFKWIRNIFNRSVAGFKLRWPRSGAPGWIYSTEGAMCVATVYRCVKLLSESVASLPILYKQLNDYGVFETRQGGNLWYLLNVQPDQHINAFDFWAQTTQDVLLDGNAYIVPVYSALTMDIERLALCHPNTVTYDWGTNTYRVADSIAGIAGEFAEEEIIHIKGLGPDQRRGLSVLQYAHQTTSIACAGDGETLDRVQNGGIVRGIVSNSGGGNRPLGEYLDSELKNAAADVDSRLRNGERVISLPGSTSFTPMALSSADLQFLETRKFTVREICRFFGVHPSFVFDDTSNNYKDAENATAAFLTNTLNPILRKIETELLRKLVSPEAAPYRRFSFDRAELYSADLANKMKYLSQKLGAGMSTVNELRAMEGRNPVEGGDDLLVSANLKSIKELTQQKGLGL